MEYNDESLKKWFFEDATFEEKALYERVQELSEYFEDMTFENEKELQGGFFVPEKIYGFGYSYITYRIKAMPGGIAGYYNANEQEFAIDAQYATDDNVILHEMIHLHEHVISDLPTYYHDRLLWNLYQELKVKIPELDNAISIFMSWENLQGMDVKGGTHSLLFALKSFDLDIKMNNTLGTVMGYDGLELFGEYRYK